MLDRTFLKNVWKGVFVNNLSKNKLKQIMLLSYNMNLTSTVWCQK